MRIILLKVILNIEYFLVDINKFTGFDGFYTYNSKAPLLKTAIEVFNCPKLKADESYLFEFFKNFKPKIMENFIN